MKETNTIYTPWNVDENNVLHMQFPMSLILNVSDEDWVAYKNGIIQACIEYSNKRNEA